jgi:hypothetical protein
VLVAAFSTTETYSCRVEAFISLRFSLLCAYSPTHVKHVTVANTDTVALSIMLVELVSTWEVASNAAQHTVKIKNK